MTRTSASFTSGPPVATTTPALQRKCRVVSRRGRPACQGNVNDAKAHNRSRFHSYWPGSGVRRWPRRCWWKTCSQYPPRTDWQNFQRCCKLETVQMGMFSVKKLFFLSPTSFVKKKKTETHENSGLIYSRLAISCVIASDNLPRIKGKGREGIITGACLCLTKAFSFHNIDTKDSRIRKGSCSEGSG